MRTLISPRIRLRAAASPSRRIPRAAGRPCSGRIYRPSLRRSLYAVAVVLRGTTKVGQLDLNSDPAAGGPNLLMRVGTEHITSTRPTPDRFVYTVEYGDWRLYGAEQDLTPELRRLVQRWCSTAAARVTRVPIGRARERAYPRSVGVLGHGFLAEPVLQQLLRALPPATYYWTYGGDADPLTQLQRQEPKRAEALQIWPHAANTSWSCCTNWKI